MDEVVRDAVATSIAPTLPPIRDDDNGNNNDNGNGNDNDHIATQEDDEADALLVDVDDDNEETEEDDVSMQIEQRDKEDNALVEECIEKEIESAISITEKAPQSMYITDPHGNKVHKKTLLSNYINKGISLPEKDGDDELELNDGGDEQNNVRAKKKSMDREARARSSNRHNNQTDSASDNIITRAFNRFTYDDSIDPNSGTDRHNSDDFCAVIIKAKPAQGNNVSKIVHLVICKYQRFGGSSGAQLSLSWSRNDSKYRATVNVVSVAE